MEDDEEDFRVAAWGPSSDEAEDVDDAEIADANAEAADDGDHGGGNGDDSASYGHEGSEAGVDQLDDAMDGDYGGSGGSGGSGGDCGTDDQAVVDQAAGAGTAAKRPAGAAADAPEQTGSDTGARAQEKKRRRRRKNDSDAAATTAHVQLRQPGHDAGHPPPPPRAAADDVVVVVPDEGPERYIDLDHVRTQWTLPEWERATPTRPVPPRKDRRSLGVILEQATLARTAAEFELPRIALCIGMLSSPPEALLAVPSHRAYRLLPLLTSALPPMSDAWRNVVLYLKQIYYREHERLGVEGGVRMVIHNRPRTFWPIVRLAQRREGRRGLPWDAIGIRALREAWGLPVGEVPASKHVRKEQPRTPARPERPTTVLVLTPELLTMLGVRTSTESGKGAPNGASGAGAGDDAAAAEAAEA